MLSTINKSHFVKDEYTVLFENIKTCRVNQKNPKIGSGLIGLTRRGLYFRIEITRRFREASVFEFVAVATCAKNRFRLNASMYSGFFFFL